MTRQIINPLLIATLGILAWGICRLAGINPHSRELVLAAGICFVAAELAFIPLFVTRGKSQATVSQAALLATVIHLMLSIGLGFGISSALRAGQPLMWWLMLFYPATSAMVALASIRAVRSAPIELPASQAKTVSAQTVS